MRTNLFKLMILNDFFFKTCLDKILHQNITKSKSIIKVKDTHICCEKFGIHAKLKGL